MAITTLPGSQGAQEQQKPVVNWGGLTKKILGGVAIAIGASLVFYQKPEEMITALKGLGDKIGAALEGSGANEELSKSITWLAKKVGGVVLAVTGYKYFTHKSKPEYTWSQENKESFVMQQDMAKLKNLTMLRAAYAGNPEAQAMLQKQQGPALA